jgi:hypothetical protein
MFFDSKRVSKFSLAQIAINSPGTKFYFPDQPQLRGKKMQKIVCYFDVLYPKNPDNITVIDQNAMLNGFLILYVNGRDDIKMPLYHLVTQTQPGIGGSFFTNNGYIPLSDLPIVWEKSYVLVPSIYTPVAPQETFMFGVFYAD